MKGIFITLEGTEGVGKSTQVRLLQEYCIKNNIDALFLREPGGTNISEKLREILLDKNNSDMTYETEALLYAACRMQIVSEVILPALKSGKIVICDRYIDSSLAYQGYARGLGEDYIKSINKYAIENCMPNYTIFLKLNPKDSFIRKGGADTKDRLELMGMDFHNKVYYGYTQIALKDKNRVIEIEPTGDKYDTHRKIVEHFIKMIK